MSDQEEKIWKQFLRNHMSIFIVWIIIALGAIIAALYVLTWFVGNAQATGLVPEPLNLWALSHIIIFFIWLIIWMLILVGIPLAIIAGAFYVLWWKQLPQEERNAYKQGHLFGHRSKRSDGGGALSFFIFIVFIIKIYLDGNWASPIASWSFDYLFSSWLTALFWVAGIIGIPLLIGLAWWIHYSLKTEP